MPKKRKKWPLCERQVWLLLAEAFRKAIPDKQGHYYTTPKHLGCPMNQIEGNWIRGLCTCLGRLFEANHIDATVYWTARDAIDNLPYLGGGSNLYKWGFGIRGRNARIRFCLKQAERLKGKTK